MTQYDEDTIELRRGPWRFVWAGGRLCDIHIGHHGVDCFQVGDYDWERGERSGPFTATALAVEVDAWWSTARADYEGALACLL